MIDERLKILCSHDLAGSQDMMSRSPFYLVFSEFRVFFSLLFPFEHVSLVLRCDRYFIFKKRRARTFYSNLDNFE